MTKVSVSSLHCPNVNHFSGTSDGLTSALCPRCKAMSPAESFIISARTDLGTPLPASSDTSGIESSYDADDGANRFVTFSTIPCIDYAFVGWHCAGFHATSVRSAQCNWYLRSGTSKDLVGIERVCWAIASTKHQKVSGFHAQVNTNKMVGHVHLSENLRVARRFPPVSQMSQVDGSKKG